MTILSKSEKLTILQQKTKNIEYQKYSLELDILLENASDNPDSDNIKTSNSKLAEIAKKIKILNDEKKIVEEMEEDEE